MGASPLLKARQQYKLTLPQLFEEMDGLSFSKDKPTRCLGDEKEIKELFPHLFGQPILKGFVDKGASKKKEKPLKIGVVLSGGQASGGHNVITGLFDALKKMHRDSQVIGFLNGPSGIVEGKHKELDATMLANFRNTGGFDLIGSGRTKIETEEQLKHSLQVVKTAGLDGLVVIGGDDSNTNAAVLAEYFLKQGCQTQVIGVPKTIDGDLQNEWLEISFGFDTACKTYSEMISNLARDALSAKKYTHFIKLMGRSASHIALECALQTHPNLTLIAEEVVDKKQTIKEITADITEVVMQRSEAGKNYGLILIPEGLIELIPEMNALIGELNTFLAKPDIAALAPKDILEKVKTTLKGEIGKTFAFLPESIQKQLLLDRDPHGNVQVAHINTEELFIETVTKELKSRGFKGKFSPLQHSFGYEGRAGFPSNFDATYCYALGFTAAALIREGYSGYMASLKDLVAPSKLWSPIGIPLTSLMHLEMRKGKKRPVIEKALVDLNGKPFKTFKSRRERWKVEDDYCFPGPIQFFGDPSITDSVPIIVQLKLN
jgi:pyrophosphate--fructose-6-phosphate 1-phosphotransferase